MFVLHLTRNHKNAMEVDGSTLQIRKSLVEMSEDAKIPIGIVTYKKILETFNLDAEWVEITFTAKTIEEVRGR
jgi:hypothetical protein